MKHFFSSLFLLSFLNGALFAQTVPPLTNTISGKVWLENKPSNGIREGSETAVSGVLIKLFNTAVTPQVAVSTTISGADGSFTLSANEGTYRIQYIFSTIGYKVAATRQGSDNTVNSAALSTRYSAIFTIAASTPSNDTYGLGLIAQDNTITSCTSYGPQATDWSQSLTLPKSNIAPQPISVNLFVTEAVSHPFIGFENTASAYSYDISVSGVVSMTLPFSGELFKIASDVSKLDVSLAAYDGITNYSGASGISWYNEFGSNSLNYVYDDYLSSFVGPGNFAIPTSTKGSIAYNTGGNATSSISTIASVGACVVYTYESGALPVKLASFTAKAEGKIANLNWATTEESNSDRFDVEKSRDGKKWKAVGSVEAKGESSIRVPYSFSDNTPSNGINLYRLKMVDRDGTFAYSRINSVHFAGLPTINIYPNPVASLLSVTPLNDEEITKIQIFNSTGKMIKETLKVSEPIDVTKIAGGIYSVRIIYTNGSTDNRKVIIGH